MELAGKLGLFALGVMLVVKSGDWFVDAAGWLAGALGVPPFLVGATVVSLATTLPEILVSVMAASQGKTDMAVGNGVGSVIANTALILAASMVCLPMAVSRRQLGVPCLLLTGAAAVVWAACGSGSLAAWGSWALILLCGGFFAFSIRTAEAEGAGERRSRAGMGRKIGLFLLGAAGIVAGSRLLIAGGEGIARILGVPERIIAVTLIALGTSLPELVTAAAAIVKKEAGLSIGNVLGANIIDLTLILPLCRLASGGTLPVSEQSLALDLPVCLAAVLTAAAPMLLGGRVSRVQGVLLWLLYGGYLLCVL